MREAFCIASGPSLTAGDCDRVRKWRSCYSERGVVVCNNTFEMAPWADYLYAMDNEWWRVYGDRVKETFQGETFSRFGHYARKVKQHGHNSGAGAILLAAERGYRVIYLLGYDCAPAAGRWHWHADHPKPLKNCGSIGRWPDHFQQVKRALAPDVTILNASRQSALDMFPKIELESVT